MLKTGLAASALLLTFALSSCGSGNGPQEGAEMASEMSMPDTEPETITVSAEQFKANDMQIGGLELREFHEKVRTNGRFDSPPANQAVVSAYFGGYVKAFDLLPGQHIHKGQVMFTLENPEYIRLQEQFLEAQGTLAYLKSDYERQKGLLEGQVTSEKKYLKAESEYNVTLARHASLKKQLDLMNISAEDLRPDNIRSTITVKAPISGLITSIQAHAGMFLNPSDIAATITNTDHLHLELSVFEQDLPHIAIGQEIRFKLPNEAEFKHKASVHLVNKFIDQESRTASIHAHLEDEDAGYAPGMYAEVEIWTKTDKALALPETAVIKQQAGSVVLLEGKQEMHFETIPVEIGRSEGGYVEILNAADFHEGSAVLTRGAFNLVSE